jgi:hypothetical protein
MRTYFVMLDERSTIATLVRHLYFPYKRDIRNRDCFSGRNSDVVHIYNRPCICSCYRELNLKYRTFTVIKLFYLQYSINLLRGIIYFIHTKLNAN